MQLRLLTVFAVLVATAVGILVIRPLARRLRGNQPAPGGNLLRQAVLSRDMLPKTDSPTAVPALQAGLMDWHIGTGVATLVAFSDGTVSLYYSSGGGIIGGGAHATVQTAAARFLTLLTRQLGLMRPSTGFALPGPNQVIFWAVQSTETLCSHPFAVSDVSQPEHPFAAAGDAAQETITALRQVPGA